MFLTGLAAKRTRTMKVSIEIDLTPEEARALLGMPNMSAIQDVFVGMAKDKLEKTSSLVDLEPMLKTWTGLGGAATDVFGALVGAALKAASSDGASKAGPDKPSASRTVASDQAD
jgi:Family of unknown function (DUF6489)